MKYWLLITLSSFLQSNLATAKSDPLIWSWISSPSVFKYDPAANILFDQQTVSAIARIDIFLSAPISAQSLRLERCSGRFNDGNALALNFGEHVAFADGGKTYLSFTWPAKRLPLDKVHAVSVFLPQQRRLCISTVKWYDSSGQILQVNWPKTMKGEIRSDKVAIQFGELKNLTLMMVFGGDRFLNFERGVHVQSAADDDQDLELPLSPGLQLMPISWKGTQILVERGVSGLGLSDGAQMWRWLDPESTKRVTNPPVLVDQEWIASEAPQWRFRFRSDQSFYIKGRSRTKGRDNMVGTVGTFEFEQVNPKKFLLHLKGKKLKFNAEADVPPCAEGCSPGNKDKPTSPFDEELEFAKSDQLGWMMRNRSKVETRFFDFTDLKVRPSHVDD